MSYIYLNRHIHQRKYKSASCRRSGRPEVRRIAQNIRRCNLYYTYCTVGIEGFIVVPLRDKLKSKKGFRVTSPEGYYTDFIVDDKTNLVKSYESSYSINGRDVTTSVEIDKTRNVDGVFIPEKYAQRFDLGALTVYSEFKAKEILVNSKVVLIL